MRRTRFVKTVSAFALLASIAAAPAFVGLGCDGGDGDEAMEELEDEAEDAGDEIEDEIDDHS
jgi:hypothetical protein